MFSKKVVVCLLAAALGMPARAEEPGAEQPPAPAVVQQEGAAAPESAAEEASAAAEAAAASAERPRPGDDQQFGESISVTATRSARRTRDVPQAISVVGKEQLEDKVVFNVKDVIAGTPGVLVESKNGGYDARLLIRGAGLKANYGVREIMVLRDGVPLTDPDSFTRLDWVDTQDVERIEIAKGPGNLFSPGSAGGAIQILSRSVFDPGADTARAAVGTHGAGNFHLRTSSTLAGNALALSASYRQQENDWRLWNEFSTLQVSLKHGIELGEGGTLESEAAYTQADAQLPGVMDGALYAGFVETGEQSATSEPWKHSGRYSRILFVNSKLEHRLGGLLLKPRVYYNQWTHLHPVTGFINETEDWTRTAGTDLEAQHAHRLLGAEATLVVGVTAKAQWNDDVRRYEYRDVTHAGGGSTGRILATLSDEKGELMETQTQRNLLVGAFAQESLRLHERVVVDVGFRFDRSSFRIHEDQLVRYDYGRADYVDDPAVTTVDKTFDLPAPKVGVSVRATERLSVYASAARASQIPSESEIVSNAELDAAETTSYEVGMKLRARRATLDLAGYWMDVNDEIVSSVQGSETKFLNAGETRKRGVEVSASFRLLEGLDAGASYGYSDYRYASFVEPVQVLPAPPGPPQYRDADRSGNRLPYVPEHQWGLFASWRHPSGFRARVQSSTWGEYWLDNANTATYPGYLFLTSVGAAYAFGRHEVVLDVENVFDRRYAMQVVKAVPTSSDPSGKTTYAAGSPRFVSVGYRFGL